MRIPHEVWREIEKLLIPGVEIELDYPQHGCGPLVHRRGPIENLGAGPNGPFLTLNTDAGVRSFSVHRMENFRVLKPV